MASPYQNNFGTIVQVVPGTSTSRYARMYAYVKYPTRSKATEICDKAFGQEKYTIDATNSYCAWILYF